MTESVSIFGIPITLCTLPEGIRLIEELIDERTPRLIVLANVHTLNLAYEHKSYRQILRKSALVLRDGTGVAWAAKRIGICPKHNFVGTDFIPDFCKRTARKGYSLFFLGAKPGVAESAAAKLASLAPGVTVAGVHHGYFSEEQSRQVISKINKTNSDILLVAMGNPRQETWISTNINSLRVPVCMGVGALFDYLSGSVVRAPKWILNTGAEWIFRLAVEPRRLWKRYLIGNPKFIIRVQRELKRKKLTECF